MALLFLFDDDEYKNTTAKTTVKNTNIDTAAMRFLGLSTEGWVLSRGSPSPVCISES